MAVSYEGRPERAWSGHTTRIKAIPDANLAVPASAIRTSKAIRGQRRQYDSARLHRLIAASRLIRVMSIGALARLELAFLGGHKEPDVIASIHDARRGAESLLSGNEAFTLYSLARAQSGMAGDMAEVGVYQGCSAKIISVASGGCPLHLFDTFEGLPDPDASEHRRMRKGHYAASLESVRAFLADRQDISFNPGLFSAETASSIADRQFSFVHLDVDLKSSTLDCLAFFYPRMVPGGIILTHDYSYLIGVREAFTEFLSGRPETAIELPTSQAMLVKL